jgi:hypothetical protein
LSVTDRGAALLRTSIEADRAPAAVGLKFTVMVHVPLAATGAPQLLVATKSVALAPATVMVATCRVPAPELRRVMVCAALVDPVAVLENVTLVGVSVTTGAAVAAPVPLRVIKRVVTLLRISSDAVRDPDAVGRNATLIVHVPPATTVLLQL